jgi:hypothetical protein
VASALNLKGCSFLTDNKTLALTTSTGGPSLHQVPREIRRQVAAFKALHSQASIFHISRNLNNIAHKALRLSMSKPILSCSSTTHSHVNCPYLSAVSQINLQDLIIHVVNCL